ncbi:MAG: 30S ribosomal protein S17 [Acidobacteriota bacterium]
MSEEIKQVPTSPTPAATAAKSKTGRRAEKVGIVVSNKMTKTVVVRVDRLVRHQKYQRYIRRRTKFMAHSEMACNIGDKVKIVETRPLSAHKRWRVVEILQKAEL